MRTSRVAHGRLIEKGIHWIRVHPRIEDGSADHDMETWERALAAYSHALKVVREAADKASKGTAGSGTQGAWPRESWT
jgi:hypothetical protein